MVNFHRSFYTEITTSELKKLNDIKQYQQKKSRKFVKIVLHHKRCITKCWKTRAP